jgi:hypothetical protein
MIHIFKPAQSVAVLYDPSTLADAEIDSFQTLWFGPVFVVVFGGVIYGLAQLRMRVWRRQGLLGSVFPPADKRFPSDPGGFIILGI